MVDPPGCVAPLGDAEEPVDGEADEPPPEAPPEPPPAPPPLEPPEEPCAHAVPAIRQPASKTVEIVR
jgi:hypothetical protein